METIPEFRKAISRRLASGEAESALELSRQAVERWPEDESLLCLLARSEEGVGQVDGARRRLEALVAAYPESADPRFELGRLLIGLGRVEDARGHLRSCLENDPGHAAAWTLLARLDRHDGKRADALSGLRTALRADPDHVPALTSLAELLLEQGDQDGANEQASRAIQLQPEGAAPQLSLARVFAAGGMSAFAQRCLDNAVSLAPDNAQIRNTAGHLYLKLGRDRSAAEHLAAARALGLDDAGNLSALALSLARMGRVREALAVVERAEPGQLPGELIRELGEAALRINNNDALDSVADLASRIGTLPEETRVWMQALQAHVCGQWQQALDLAERLIESDDAELSVRARVQAARSNLRATRNDAAAAMLEPLIDEPRLSAPAHWELAALFRQAGRPESAIRALRALLERPGLDEESATLTRARLLDLLDRAGRYEEASGLLDKAGWQAPYLGEPAYLDLDDRTLEAVIGDEAGRAENLDTAASSGPRMVFVTGWACTGRDLIVPALACSQEVTALPATDWPRRRERLGLPVDPDSRGRMDGAEFHALRRAYLRGYAGKPVLLEPAVLQAIDLAHLARLFPSAVVINSHADTRYLKTQWRLLGYRQIPSMLHAWQCEQKAMAILRESGAIQVVDCALEDLVDDPAGALNEGCRALGIHYLPLMDEAVAMAFEQHGYRHPDHWRHYAGSAD